MNESSESVMHEGMSTSMAGLGMDQTIPQPMLYRPVSWSSLAITKVPRNLYSFLAIFMAFVMVSSGILNGIVISATKKFSNMRKPLNYLLLNLAVADLLSAILGGTPTIVANMWGHYAMGKYVCWSNAFTIGTLGIVDLMSITILSFSRYLITCRPPWFSQFRRSHAVMGVAFTWLWSSIWHIPPFFWNGYDIHGVGASCGMKWTWKGYSAHIYLILYFSFCFFAPLAVIVLSYLAIACHIRTTNRQSSLDPKVTKRTSRKTTKMIITIMLAFLACWTPYACVGLYTIIFPRSQVNQYISTVPAYLAKTATIYNPCIYILMNSKLKFNVCQVLNWHNVPLESSTASASLVSARRITTLQKSLASPMVGMDSPADTKL